MARQSASTAAIEHAKAYLDDKGVEYVERTATTAEEVALAAQALVSDGVDAVFTPTDNTIMKAELAIYETFADAGIPHYTGADSFALNGAFLGYGVDYANLGRETADMIASILTEGKSAKSSASTLIPSPKLLPRTAREWRRSRPQRASAISSLNLNLSKAYPTP